MELAVYKFKLGGGLQREILVQGFYRWLEPGINSSHTVPASLSAKEEDSSQCLDGSVPENWRRDI